MLCFEIHVDSLVLTTDQDVSSFQDKVPLFGGFSHLMANSTNDQAGSQVLRKAASILDALEDCPDGATASALARAVGMPTSTVHRLLGTLVDLRLIDLRPDSRHYVLGLRLFELGQKTPHTGSIVAAAGPAMRILVERTRESALLATLEGDRMRYIADRQGPRRLSVRAPIGMTGPLHCTSQGKALLALLPVDESDALINRLELPRYTENTVTDPTVLRTQIAQIRKQGYACINQEHEEGIAAISVGIQGPNDIAAICVAMPAVGNIHERILSHLPALREAAAAIQNRL